MWGERLFIVSAHPSTHKGTEDMRLNPLSRDVWPWAQSRMPMTNVDVRLCASEKLTIARHCN